MVNLVIYVIFNHMCNKYTNADSRKSQETFSSLIKNKIKKALALAKAYI